MLVPVNGKDAERPSLYFNHVNEMALLALSVCQATTMVQIS